jgi:DNA-binding IscR family transcriptional regulator
VALCCEDEEAGQPSHEGEPCVACRVLAKCPIQSPMQQFDDLVRTFLSSVTLADLLNGKTSIPVVLTYPGART